MGAFVKGDIVVAPFPFSGSLASKRRPALVLASWPLGTGTDYLLCLITSRNVPDPYMMDLRAEEIENGSLARRSYLRPSYLFSADESLIAYKVGNVQSAKLQQVIAVLVNILQS